MKILIVEDDKELCKAIQVLLEKEGYSTYIFNDGIDASYYLSQNICDLIIMDRMMPGMDGLALTASIRKKNITVPIIMLTAMGSIDDRVDGLDAGADDYLVKPFDSRELLARIRAAIRRPTLQDENENLKFSNISLDNNENILKGDNNECTLTKKEAELLYLFMSKPSQALQRNFLFAKVWGMESDVEESILDSYIHFLRRRIKSVSEKVIITTIRGVGYKMEEKHN